MIQGDNRRTRRKKIVRVPHFVFLLALQHPLWVCILRPSNRALASSRKRFLDHTQQRATVGRTPLNEWSIRRRDLYLTTHNTHNRQTSMSPVGFEPTIAAGERPQTYALDRAATGIKCHTVHHKSRTNCPTRWSWRLAAWTTARARRSLSREPSVFREGRN